MMNMIEDEMEMSVELGEVADMDEKNVPKHQDSYSSICTIQRRSGKIWNHDDKQRILSSSVSSDIQLECNSNTSTTTLNIIPDRQDSLAIESQETLESDQVSFCQSEKNSDFLETSSEKSVSLSSNIDADQTGSSVSESLYPLKKSKGHRRQPIQQIFKAKVYKEFPWESFQEKDDLLSREEFHKKKKAIKFRSVLSIIEEISKDTVDLLNTDVNLQYPETPTSLYANSTFESEKSIDMPFPSPISLLQQRENSYGDEEVFEEQPSRTSLFRRSIFGGYIPENTFQDIRSSLKEIIQHNRESKEMDGLSDQHMHHFSTDDNSTNSCINLNMPVSPQNHIKSSELLEINKESHNNPTSYSNRLSEARLSLQETSNLNNSIGFRMENHMNSKPATAKRESSFIFASNTQKDVDEKSISKEKNTKNTTFAFEAKRIANNENIRPNNDTSFNSRDSNKIGKNYSYSDVSILGSNDMNKRINSEDFSSANSYNNTHSTRTEYSNEDGKCNMDSDKLSSWLLSVKNKYRNINLEEVHDVCNSMDLDSKYSQPQIENNQVIDIFSFSKLSNKSFFTMKKTLNSFKKK